MDAIIGHLLPFDVGVAVSPIPVVALILLLMTTELPKRDRFLPWLRRKRPRGGARGRQRQQAGQRSQRLPVDAEVSQGRRVADAYACPG
jgi:hypothetical protein